MDPQLKNILTELQIDFEVHSHAPFFTCEQADAYYSELEGGFSKNLFLRNKKGNQHYLVVVESHKSVDLKKLGSDLSERLSFASPERLEKYLKIYPGAVSPFGLIHDATKHVIVILDQALIKHDLLYYHPGTNEETLQIKCDDFLKFLKHLGHELILRTL